jgi:hypothetical protein
MNLDRSARLLILALCGLVHLRVVSILLVGVIQADIRNQQAETVPSDYQRRDVGPEVQVVESREPPTVVCGFGAGAGRRSVLHQHVGHFREWFCPHKLTRQASYPDSHVEHEGSKEPGEYRVDVPIRDGHRIAHGSMLLPRLSFVPAFGAGTGSEAMP